MAWVKQMASGSHLTHSKDKKNVISNSVCYAFFSSLFNLQTRFLFVPIFSVTAEKKKHQNEESLSYWKVEQK